MHLFVTLLAMTLAIVLLTGANFVYQMFMGVPDFDAAVERSLVHGSVIVFAAILVIYFHMKFLRKKAPPHTPATEEETV